MRLIDIEKAWNKTSSAKRKSIGSIKIYNEAFENSIKQSNQEYIEKIAKDDNIKTKIKSMEDLEKV